MSPPISPVGCTFSRQEVQHGLDATGLHFLRGLLWTWEEGRRVSLPEVLAATDKPVALTLKIDGDMYMRLDMLCAKERRTHQDILKQALEEFLDRVEA